MRKVLLVLLLAFYGMTGFSQFGAYFHAGYNTNWGKFDGINQVISRYNESHQGISNHMDKIGFLHGPAAGLGIFVNGLNINVDFKASHQLVSAHLADSISGNTREDIKLRMNTLNISFGSYPNVDHAFALGFGVSLDLGNAAVFNRKAATETIDDTLFYKIGSHNFIGFSPHLQLFFKPGSNIIMSIKPYYQVFSSITDLTDVDELINPNAGPVDGLGIDEAKFNHFGIYFSLGFSL